MNRLETVSGIVMVHGEGIIGVNDKNGIGHRSIEKADMVFLDCRGDFDFKANKKIPAWIFFHPGILIDQTLTQEEISWLSQKVEVPIWTCSQKPFITSGDFQPIQYVGG